jgi:hypothetical protein
LQEAIHFTSGFILWSLSDQVAFDAIKAKEAGEHFSQELIHYKKDSTSLSAGQPI